MRNYPLHHSTRHMFLALAGFVAAILLLESDGLANWADRLEPGPLRAVAQPSVTALNRALRPLGLADARDRALDEVARMGWSDDAVRLARVAPPPSGQIAPLQTQPSHVASAPSSPRNHPRDSSMLAAAAAAPLVGNVPRSVNISPLPVIEQGRQRVVALAGDSMMAVGFGSGLMRKAGGDKNLRIVRAFKSGTGLARPDVFNWMDQYPAMLGPERPDVVIVAIGANDGQSFVVDGKVILFGSEEWRKAYQSRVADFLAMVESSGARVLWIGLPPMRSVPFNQRITLVNRIAYTVVSRDPRASWWSTASYVGDAAGGFREFAELPNGALLRLRAPDGIHFAEEGASTMTTPLLKWLDPAPQRAEVPHRNTPVRAADPANNSAHSPLSTVLTAAR